MEIIIKNDFILQELENSEFNQLKTIIQNIQGEITIEKIYQNIFSSLGINFYTTTDNKYYIELKKYIEDLTNNSCKESQLLKNKEAVDKDKVKNLSEINIKNKYEKHKLTNKKKVIEISGLNTVNDSIKRFGKNIPVTFFQWHKLCEMIVLNLPIVVESSIKKFFQKEFDEIKKRDTEKQKLIDEIREKNNKLQEENEQIKNKLNSFQKQLDEIRNLI